jgi:hypothetical protein
MTTYRKFRDIDYGKPIIAPTHGDTVAPQNDLAAAAWLPVSKTATNALNGFHVYDYQRHVFTDKVVIMPGKLVALTREALTNGAGLSEIGKGTAGRLLPAGVRLAWKAAAATYAAGGPGSDTNVIQYTKVDVAERVECILTGLPCTKADIGLHAYSDVLGALQGRGLLLAGETLDAFISRPIGVAANVVYAWAGGDGTQPNKLRFHNYRRENKSTFWTGQDHTLRLPVMPNKFYGGTLYDDNEDPMIEKLEIASRNVAFATLGDLTDGALTVATPAQLKSVLSGKYAELATTAPCRAFVMGVARIESNLYNPIEIWDVDASPEVDKTSIWLKTEKSTPAMIKKVGDYYVDRDLGIVFLHEASTTGTDGTDSYTIVANTDYAFRLVAANAAGAFNIGPFAAVVGAVKPGDYLTYDLASNFIPYVARPDETKVVATDGANAADANDDATVDATAYVDPTTYHRPEDIVGKCYTLDRSPKADLAAVKTFHDYDGVSLADRTPGSANDGHPAEIHQSFGGQFAAIVRVLL